MFDKASFESYELEFKNSTKDVNENLKTLKNEDIPGFKPFFTKFRNKNRSAKIFDERIFAKNEFFRAASINIIYNSNN